MQYRPALALAFSALLTSACGASSDSGSEETPTGSSSSGSEATDSALAAVIAGPQRSEENRARDAHRHPQETLEFFGITPTSRVIEISPGGGWYTEILAPYLREQGTLSVGIPSAEGTRAQYRQRFIDLQTERADVLGGVQVVTFDPPSAVDLGPEGSADLVVTFRNTHGWINDGVDRQAFEAFFRVLRPGGVLGVEQHRAAEGAVVTETSPRGYIPEAYVIEIAEAAGFVLDARSEINANPRDTHDHPEGVWTLPPNLRLGDVDRERYVAIGESDRMTLRFLRPEAAAAE